METTRGSKGGSDKATIHKKRFPTRGQAEDAARNAGRGKPVEHQPHKPGERPHFHPTDKKGEIIKGGREGGVHYEH